MHPAFFADSKRGIGPALTEDIIASAERTLGVRLPASYLAVLRARNGGVPMRRCFPTTRATSWATDHISLTMLLGIGYEDGIDGSFGSAYMVAEWGYPPIGIVVCRTASAGPDTIMLDYTRCGPMGEPCVSYVDEDRSVLVLAPNFASFANGLVDCARFAVASR